MNNGKHQKKAQRESSDEFCKRLGIRIVNEKGGMESSALPRLSESVQGSAGQGRQQRGETYPGDRRYVELLST